MSIRNTEREGRHAAKRLGLRVIGVGGILLDARSHDAIKAARPHPDALCQTTGFYLGDAVYDDALSLAGESDG